MSLTTHDASEILAFRAILCEELSVVCAAAVAYPGIFSGGVQQFHLRTEDRRLALALCCTKKDLTRVLCLSHLHVRCCEMLGLIQS